MSDPQNISKKTYSKFYSEKNFIGIFLKSVIISKNKCRYIVLFLLCILPIIFLQIDNPYPYDLIVSKLNSILFTYSITVLGFLLVSFSILIGLGSNKNVFQIFTDSQNEYKTPLLKSLLLHFVFPAGLFASLFIISLVVNVIQIFEIEFPEQFKEYIFKAFLFISMYFSILSVLELFSYFFNITQFIFITNYYVSDEYENDVINKLYVTQEKIPKTEEDQAQRIKANIDEQLK